MTDETKRGAKKSNKIKIRLKSSIFGRILISFASALRFLKRKSNLSLRYFSNPKNIHGFNHSISGYVMILIVMAVPVLLFGAKYVLDQRTLSDQNTTLGSGKLVKQCAGKAAKAVAEKWNPALTYAQQREAMLRIADEIYNNSNAYLDSPMVRAVHGINTPRKVKGKVGAYSPIKVTESTESLQTEFEPGEKTVARTGQSTDMKRYYFYYYYKTNHAPMAVKHFDIMYASLKRSNANLFPPDEDLYQDYVYYCENTTDPLGKEVGWYHYVTWPEVVGMSSSDGTPENVEPKSYTTRTDLDDETVKIEVEGDKIKVTTDDDVAYAEPAKCNVDIILTVPTNSAALNQNNNDKNTSTSGTPYISESTTPTDDAKETPICEITRAYQEFLKENFFYTRGVNVGVIPYSGKVSLRSDRSDWVKDPDEFVDDGNTNIVGAALYGTKGENGEKLTEIGSFAGGDVSYGLLCRGNTENYGSNKITKGDLLLSTENPTTSDIYKFRKMVYDPCYLTDANLLSMKCENGGNKYWMNPYFILEMNPDVKFIYNMLGAFYPYYDDRNVSNFIFIPVTWANNLLQSWSATGGNSAQNTSANSTTLGRLSTPSKGTKDDGRKKVLILIVNKPDWFEPGELTYLGFDNDYSETLAVESDLIRFDKGKTSGAKGILKYDSSQGILSFPRKGLLRIVVEPTSGTGKIKFTNVSGSYPSATKETSVTKRSEFFITPDKIDNTMNNNNYYVGITLTSTKLVSAEITNRPYKVESGKVVYTKLNAPNRSVFIDLLKSNNEKFNYEISGADSSVTPSSHLVYGSDGDGNISDVGIKYQSPTYTPTAQTASNSSPSVINPNASENPKNWTSIKIGTGGPYCWKSVCYGNGKFVAVSGNNSDVAAYSDDGKIWHKSKLPYSADWCSVCYGNGTFVAIPSEGSDNTPPIYSTDGITWNGGTISSSYGTGNWRSVNYVSFNTWNDKKKESFYVIGNDHKYMLESSDGKETWGKIDLYNDHPDSLTRGLHVDGLTNFLVLDTDTDNFYLCKYTSSNKHKWIKYASNNSHFSVMTGMVEFGFKSGFLYAMTGIGILFADGAFHYRILKTESSDEEKTDFSKNWKVVSLPEGNIGNWESVCRGESKSLLGDLPIVVAVAKKEYGKMGTGAYLDGDVWTRSDLTDHAWTSVCWGKVDGQGRFVTVSEDGMAAYSDDGMEWTEITLLASPNFKSVCYGNGKFVAVSDNSCYAAYSDDGIEWTLVELGSGDWRSVCYGDGIFVAVGGKKVIFSSDGINWQEDTSEIISFGVKKKIAEVMGRETGEWRSVCYGDGQFVAISNEFDRLYGTVGDWNIYQGGADCKFSSVCYGNGKIMAVGENTSTSYCASSTNLDNYSWSEVKLYDDKKDWTSVCYGNGKFVAVNNSLHKVYSTDGKNWKIIPLDLQSVRHTSVCYGNGIFVVVSQEDRHAFFSSNDVSKHWIIIDDLSGNWRSVCYSGKLGRFVAVGDNGAIAYCDVKVTVKYVAVASDSTRAIYSSNGIDWYETDVLYISPQSVCYGNGKFVAVGDGGSTYSDDGINWKDSGLWTNVRWQSVCYGNGKFVAVGMAKTSGSSIFAYSDDGINWNDDEENSISGGSWQSVCYGNGNFVAVGCKVDGNKIVGIAAYSENGEGWTEVVYNKNKKNKIDNDDIPKYCWSSVCYGNGKFVAVADWNAQETKAVKKVVYSSNGINWTKSENITNEDREYKWGAVCYGGEQFMAVTKGNASEDTGNDFSVSSDGVSWSEKNDKWDAAAYKSICYGDEKFVIAGENKIVCGKGENWSSINLPGDWTSVCAVRDEEPEVKPIERGWYFYNNDKSDSTNHHFIFPTNPGDMYFVTNSEEFTYKNGDIYPMEEANGFFIDVDNTYFEVNGGAVTKYLGSGLYRWTMPAEKAKGISISSNANARQFYWSVKNLGDVSLPTLYAGATLPINAALFTGGWQSKDGKWNGVDATAAVKEVTQDACTKLKTEWGDNLRIYLIKYRAQAGDYDYLNDCTSYKYDVSTKDDLNNTLSSIATDIKNWAGRTEAMNTY
ncbi:MAG: hypothetical protein J6T91_02070 [Alphaproteobacteria bacterium]|nr:hypothetical protein [Alphaproteobacteria bacterium]